MGSWNDAMRGTVGDTASEIEWVSGQRMRKQATAGGMGQRVDTAALQRAPGRYPTSLIERDAPCLATTWRRSLAWSA